MYRVSVTVFEAMEQRLAVRVWIWICCAGLQMSDVERMLMEASSLMSMVTLFRGFKYEVQHGLEIHETPDAGF